MNYGFVVVEVAMRHYRYYISHLKELSYISIP